MVSNELQDMRHSDNSRVHPPFFKDTIKWFLQVEYFHKFTSE